MTSNNQSIGRPPFVQRTLKIEATKNKKRPAGTRIWSRAPTGPLEFLIASL
jgi:hypothetical protein